MIEVTVVLANWTPNLHPFKSVIGVVATHNKAILECSDLFSMAAILTIANAEFRVSSSHFFSI